MLPEDDYNRVTTSVRLSLTVQGLTEYLSTLALCDGRTRRRSTQPFDFSSGGSEDEISQDHCHAPRTIRELSYWLLMTATLSSSLLLFASVPNYNYFASLYFVSLF